MIDIKVLRENPEKVKQNCIRRGANVDVDSLLTWDQEYLSVIQRIEVLRRQRNELSAQCKQNPEARETVKQIKNELTELETKERELKAKVEQALSWIPNFLAEDVPDGKSDADNLEIRRWGEPRKFSFQPKDHQAIGEFLKIIDTERGAKVAQSGFYYWQGKGAILAQALFFWAQQELIKRGFTSYFTPCVAKERTLFGTGYLPFFAEQTYKITGEDLALIGTSEQTLVAFHADEILPYDKLPRKLTAFTPCFRTEAGSYGKETRGIFRVHQFHKVEQIILCLPQDSEYWHQHCQENVEFFFQTLGIPYRVVKVCVGDMGAPGYKKYDVEGWFPGYGGYRELTSNTNLTDFQTRRLMIRTKTPEGQRIFLHSISSTAVTDRAVCAILENYQQEDGSVLIPEVLRPLCGFDRITPDDNLL